MVRYVIKRLLMVILVILGVLTMVFLLSVLTPGDPVEQLLGSEATEELREQKREELGLNDPLPVRYLNYIVNFVTKGDLGTSYTTKQPVWNEIMARYPYTLLLGFFSVVLAIIIAVPLGVVSALKQYSLVDNVAMFLALAFISIPSFWLGLTCIDYMAVKHSWLPAYGITDPKGWILPAVIMALGGAASITRVTRSSMLEVIRQDYIRTARAKGQVEKIVIMKHAFKNALIPIVTAIGNQMGVMIGGTVMIESVFAFPGVGKYMTDAITARNWPAVQGGVIWLAIWFSILNLLIDLLYVWMDPRLITRYNGTKGKELRRLKKEMKRNMLQSRTVKEVQR